MNRLDGANKSTAAGTPRTAESAESGSKRDSRVRGLDPIRPQTIGFVSLALDCEGHRG